MATRLDLRKRIVSRYRLPPSLPQWIDSEWINGAIGDGEREIAEETKCIEGTNAISGTSNSRLYPLTEDFIYVSRASWANASGLKKRNLDQMYDGHGDDFRNATGAPTDWYMEGARYIGFYPVLRGGSAGTFIARGPCYPRALTLDTTTSSTPSALHRAIEFYVCREIAGMDPQDNGSLEGRWGARYQNELGRYKHVRPQLIEIRAPRNA